MLPTQTKRYGDMLKDFYRGIKDGTLSDSQMNELQRVFNELWERENVYRSWLQPNKEAKFNNPTMASPTWTKSPLHTYSFQQQTDAVITNNTKTFLTFDTFYQHGNAFAVDPSDGQKIIVNSPGLTFQISGVIQWDNVSAVGYRYIALEGFKQDGTSLGFVGMGLFQGFAAEDNYFPISYVPDLAQLADMKYFKIFVRQTSGGNLTIFQTLLAVFLT